MQRDGHWLTHSFYAYVDNDPLNMTDPMGLFTWQQGLQVAGGGFETLAGVGIAFVTSSTLIGAVAGGVMAAHGLDQIQAGFRGEDTFTSQSLQASGLSQNTANSIDIGISGLYGLAAGARILPYQMVAGRAGLSTGTSLLSATIRGYIVSGAEVSGRVTEDSSTVWQGLSSYYVTTSKAAIVGRAASTASVWGGGITEAAAALNIILSGPSK